MPASRVADEGQSTGRDYLLWYERKRIIMVANAAEDVSADELADDGS